MILKARVPLLAGLEHLRDVSPAALGVPEAEVYRAMKRLPQALTRREAMRLLPAQKQRLEQVFASHADLGPYRIRDVAMFGIAECRRSELFCSLLEKGEMDRMGLFMRLSHDGDRVVRWHNGRAVPHAPAYGDADLDRLMRDSASNDPARRARAALWAQSGRYACSTPQIDWIVDAAIGLPGVLGAQIAGAGLGGCAMILARNEAVGPLLAALRKGYYAPRKLPMDAHVCVPVAGSGLLKV
jgi:galactokinase